MEEKKKVYPIIMAPTEVVFVDDSKMFLQGLELALDLKITKGAYFEDALKASEYLEDRVGKGWLKDQVRFRETEGKRDCYDAQVDIGELFESYLKYGKNTEISCVVADYSMPGINGVELLSKIKGSGVKRILLTGEADEFIAIEAFNRGQIDVYIKKSDEQALAKLKFHLEEAHFNHWERQTAFVMEALRSDKLSVAFTDGIFQQYFAQVVRDLEIVEYCILDRSGSCIMENAQGVTLTMYVHNEDQMGAVQYVVEELGADFIPAGVVDAVWKGEKMLNFLCKEGRDYPEDQEWIRYLTDCEVIIGNGRLFWLVIRRGVPYLELGEVVTPSAVVVNVEGVRE